MERIEREAAALAALGSPARLEVFRLLARHAPHPVAAGRIAEALGRRPNTLSVQVAALARAGLVEGRRSGKQILYRVDPDRVRELLGYISDDCCNGRPAFCAPEKAAETVAPTRTAAPLVAFLCTGNSARSILAEAILNQRAEGRMRAVSAGAAPLDAILPETAVILREMGLDPNAYRPKSWRTLQGEAAETPQFAFTLCDHAADAECRFWPGRPTAAHWPLPDPAEIQDPEARMRAFRDVARRLTRKIDALLALDPATMEPPRLQAAVDGIALHG